MTSFLSWVYSQASKVYDWFGASYASLKNAAAHAWEWANDLANNAYYNAINYAWDLFQDVKNAASVSAQWVLQQIRNVTSGIVEDVTALFDWVEYKFSTINSLISSKVNQLLNSVWVGIQNVARSVDLVFDNLRAWSIAWVSDRFGWVLTLRDKITSLIQTFTPAKISELFTTLEKLKTSIMAFLDNPTVFIFDMIQDKILDFLDYVLSWGMGTVKYDLPKERPWRKG